MPKSSDFDKKNITVSLCVFIAISLGVGTAIGVLARPDDWYLQLEYVLLVPPSWVICIGGAIYFVAVGIVGHGLWLRSMKQRHWRWSFWVWCLHVVLMWSASPILYVAHRPGVAAVVIIIAAGLMLDVGMHVWRREPKLARYIVLICVWLVFLLTLCFQFTFQHLTNIGLG